MVVQLFRILIALSLPSKSEKANEEETAKTQAKGTEGIQETKEER